MKLINQIIPTRAPTPLGNHNYQAFGHLKLKECEYKLRLCCIHVVATSSSHVCCYYIALTKPGARLCASMCFVIYIQECSAVLIS